jgi:hypothetical protein
LDSIEFYRSSGSWYRPGNSGSFLRRSRPIQAGFKIEPELGFAGWNEGLGFRFSNRSTIHSLPTGGGMDARKGGQTVKSPNHSDHDGNILVP